MQIAAAVALVISAFLWVGPAVMRPDIFDGDAAHHVFWLYQYADPTLFPGDISVEYLRTSAPLGYRALYAALAPFVDVLVACEVLSGLLVVVTGMLAWKVAASVVDDGDAALRGLLGVLAYVVLLASSTGIDLVPAMAFQRTFAFPLTLLCMYGLISGRYAWAGVSWVGAALFYPVLLPVLGVGAGCVFLRDLAVTRRMPPAWIVNGLCGVAALVLALFFMPQAPELGPAYSYAQAIQMPEYGADGRLQLYYTDSIAGNYLRFHMMGMGWGPYHLAAIAVLVALALTLGERRLVPVVAWALPATGLAFWIVMRLFPEKLMFGLYLPNRHTRWSYAAFAIVAGSAGLFALIKTLRRRIPEPSSTKLSYGAALLTPLLAFTLTLSHYRDILGSPIDQDLERTYAYIASLPVDTLVAAHPDLADYIPLRSRRSVLASTETSMPWLAGYYKIVKPRVEASLRAAYATDIAAMDSALASYSVDVFVVGPAAWSATRYLEPYNGMVQQLLDRGRSEGFALQHPPAERILFRSGDYYVLKVAKQQPG